MWRAKHFSWYVLTMLNVWPCCRGKDTECAKYDRLVVRLWRGILGPQLVAQPRPLLVSAAPPPATNTLGHQTSRRCYHRGFPQFFTLPTCGPYPIHTQNLKADINAVMVFVCVVIFPTVVRQLIWSCYRPGMKEPSKSGFNERSLPSSESCTSSDTTDSLIGIVGGQLASIVWQNGEYNNQCGKEQNNLVFL